MRIERRDPYSPILQLGSALFTARKERQSGWVEVMEKDLTHLVRLESGAITGVDTKSKEDFLEAGANISIDKKAAKLFTLDRPRVLWTPSHAKKHHSHWVDPAQVVVTGVTLRQNRIDPNNLAQRIPVGSLFIPTDHLQQLEKLLLTREETRFLRQLNHPTPISMILWKRGLRPTHAGALLLALNLIGLWSDQWAPGLLPRVKESAKILKSIEAGLSDIELFGLSDEADDKALDKRFRILSLALHPDRYTKSNNDEALLAQKAFSEVSTAYNRLKQSRRKRSVRSGDKESIAKIELKKQRPDNWAKMLVEARRADEVGDKKKAKAFALKALCLSPPPGAKREIGKLLRVA